MSEELSTEQRERLRALQQEEEPPLHLEEAIVAALRRNGLIAAPRRSRQLLSWICATAVVGALVIGVVWSRGRLAPVQEPRFMILLYAGDLSETGDTTSDRRREYAEWATRVSRSGVAISGEELADEHEVLRIGTATAELNASQIAQPRGYFVVTAPTATEARRIAATCPHLRYGGVVVIRRIVS